MKYRTVHEIFDLWPSLAEFASDAGVSYGAAKQMRRRSSIPVRYWAALTASAKAREFEVTDSALASAHAPSQMDRAG